MTNYLRITWRDVIDGYQISSRYTYTIYQAVEFVSKNTSYLYLAWNGRIYKVRGQNFSMEDCDTHLGVEDLI